MLDDSHNKRAAPRKVVLGHGVITGPNMQANCIIRDLSSTGAKLGVSGKVNLPAAFDLWLVKTRSRRRVLLRWRRGDFAGVEFCQGNADNTTADASADDQDIWII
jgi:hypothetical protein